MNRLVGTIAAGMLMGGALMLAGCGPGGILFNGTQQVEQFPVRKTPITHYNLPSEMINPVTQEAVIVEARLPVQATSFIQRGPAGYDLWEQRMYNHCTDNPTCPTPAPIPDWIYANNTVDPNDSVPGGPNWKGHAVIAAYVLSFMNQWFLRNTDGNDLISAVPGQAPIMYENVAFASLKISLHEAQRSTSPRSPLITAANPSFAQQEVGDPATVGANNVPRVRVPCQNIVMWQWAATLIPAGLIAAGWQEAPGKNIHIETNMFRMDGVPAPEYFAGNGPITTKLGVYLLPWIAQWRIASGQAASVFTADDNVHYAYYLACIGTHIVGYGLGAVDSAFAVPGVANNKQQDIMNLSNVLDMSAYVAGGLELQFVVEDLQRFAHGTSGNWQAPSEDATLPGFGRTNP
ncbi:MAG: hypothetical protein IT462_10535 [Planctomycetes bacterium]|nr:hypothetical protein [Planctomycetota bacterium]